MRCSATSRLGHTRVQDHMAMTTGVETSGSHEDIPPKERFYASL
jgi:hypothetical protein